MYVCIRKHKYITEIHDTLIYVCMYVCMYVGMYPQKHLPSTELEHGPSCDVDGDEVTANSTWFKPSTQFQKEICVHVYYERYHKERLPDANVVFENFPMTIFE